MVEIDMEKLAADLKQQWAQSNIVELSRKLHIGRATISRIVSGQTKKLHLKTIRNICHFSGVGLDRYVLGQEDASKIDDQNKLLAYNQDFEGIWAYHFDKVVYIGKPVDDTLEEACMLPVEAIAKRSLDLGLSLADVERRLYDSQRNKCALDYITNWSPNDQTPTIYLGE